MKLCKDCKHSVNTSYCGGSYTAYRCHHPSNITIDPVDGKKYDSPPCKSERSATWIEFWKCGKSGRFFEPIED